MANEIPVIDGVPLKASNALSVSIEGFDRVAALLNVAYYLAKKPDVELHLVTVLNEACLLADEYCDRAHEDKRTFDELRTEARHV